MRDFEKATGVPPDVSGGRKRRGHVPGRLFWRGGATQFWVGLATFAVSIFVLGWVAGQALGATAEPEKCNRVYPAPPRVEFPGRPWLSYPLQPSGIDYVRCWFRTGQVPK